jgi:AraC-type DNA-binding domain-containing proteins
VNKVQVHYLDQDEYKDIPLLKMEDNMNNGLPFYIRKYQLSGASVYIHRHEYMQINYIANGKGKHSINKKNFDIVKGDIFVIPPYIPHSIYNGGSGTIEVYEFEFIPEFINQNFDCIENAVTFLDFAYIEPFLVSENMVSPRLNLVGGVQIETETILNEVLAEYMQRKSGFALLIKSLLLKLLIILGREFTKNLNESDDHMLFDSHRETIFKAIDYINRNFDKPISIEEVSRISFLSRSYFSYLFKSITSKTFVEYLNSIRISKAMELLRSSNKKVLEIALEVGFNNVNHFNKIFRLSVGSTPLQYKKM